MSYLRTENWLNGDSYTPVNIFKCDITGEEIPENHPKYGTNDCHISENGMEILLQQWIDLNSKSFGKPIILYFLENSLKKKRIDRYIPLKIRKEILNKYKNKCVNCGSGENLEIDHIKPLSKGGTNDFDNLQILCKECNVKKGNKYKGFSNE